MFGATFEPTGGGGGGDLVKIADTLLLANAASFLFAAIPQNFLHLKLVCSLRDLGVTSIACVQFDGDVGLNYNSLISYWAAPAVFGTVQVINGAKGDFAASELPGGMATAFRVSEVTIADYTNPNKMKAWVGPVHTPFLGTAGNIFNYFYGGVWHPAANAAITSMLITTKDNANFLAGSRITLYGMG